MIKKGISVQKLLQSFDPIHIKTNQDLVNDMSRRYLSEPEKGLFIYRWPDNSDVETEILLTGKRISEIHCSCNPNANECFHIAALLTFINKILQDKRPKIPVTAPVQKEKKSEEETLLQLISSEDLRNFVAQYAKKNKDFALDLKTTFANKLLLKNDSHIYADLIQQVIKHTGNPQQKWTPGRAAKLEKFTLRLIDQANARLAEQDFVNATQIAMALLQRIMAICYANREIDSFSFIIKALEQLTVTLSLTPLAPALRESLGDIVLQIVNNTWYAPLSMNDTLYHAVIHMDRKSEIPLSGLNVSLSDPETERDQYSILLAWWIILSHEPVSKVLRQNQAWSLKHWNNFLSVVKIEKNLSQHKPALNTVFESFIPASIRLLAMQDTLLHFPDAKRQLVFEDKIAEVILYDNAEILFDSLSAATIERLIIILPPMCMTRQDFESFGKLCKFSGQMAFASALLEEENNIEMLAGLLQFMDADWIKNRYDLFSTRIYDFLKDFYGEKNIDKVIYIIKTIYLKGLTREKELIIRGLKKKMAGRTLLMEKLQDDFPESSKKHQTNEN